MQQLCLEREYLPIPIDGFTLPGTGDSHYWCGIWQTYGCLNHKKAYIRQYKKTCFRPTCKVCYLSWATRQSNRSLLKLNQMKKNNQLHHAVITIPYLWNKNTKKNFIKTLKKSGVDAACIIYTPFDETDEKFFLKTTLNVFYYGRIDSTENSSMIVYPQNDLDGDNQTLFRTLQRKYLDCGIKKGIHPVSWIGRSQYCKLDLPKSSSNGRNCPICNKKLKLVYFNGKICPLEPDKYFSGELEKQNWKYCLTDRDIQYEINSAMQFSIKMEIDSTIKSEIESAIEYNIDGFWVRLFKKIKYHIVSLKK